MLRLIGNLALGYVLNFIVWLLCTHGKLGFSILLSFLLVASVSLAFVITQIINFILF